jgi:hypothetical protein
MVESGQMMVAVVFYPRAGIPLIQTRRVATIEEPNRRYTTGMFFIFSFRTLTRPATFIGHSVTNSINKDDDPRGASTLPNATNARDYAFRAPEND